MVLLVAPEGLIKQAGQRYGGCPSQTQVSSAGSPLEVLTMLSPTLAQSLSWLQGRDPARTALVQTGLTCWLT